MQTFKTKNKNYLSMNINDIIIWVCEWKFLVVDYALNVREIPTFILNLAKEYSFISLLSTWYLQTFLPNQITALWNLVLFATL